MSTIKTEDLLRALENKEVVESTPSDPLQEFMVHYNFQPGSTGVRIELLGVLYRQLTKTNTSNTELKKLLKLQFRCCKNGFVYVNMDTVNATAKAKEYLSPKQKLKSTSSKRHNDQFSQFVNEFNLLGSEIWVAEQDLYHLYFHWRREKRQVTLIDKKDFISFLEKQFQIKGQYIKINNSITREQLDNAKEENKKKYRKVSKPRSQSKS